MTFVEIGPDDQRLLDVLPVLKQLRPHLDAESYRAVYQRAYPEGLRYTAVYDRGRCVAVAGWRIMNTTHVGKKLYVDDLVTDADSRSGGYGSALLAELERRALDAGCAVLDLDSGVQRYHAHRFYLRERMNITSHHFAKELGKP